MAENKKICIVSGHYPSGVMFADLTRISIEEYAKIHGYYFYYDSETPVPPIVSELHFRRCLLMVKASEMFPETEWFIWLDTDIYVQFLDKRIEEFIDLSNPKILYHLFHERPKGYPVNTGVKIVHKNAIPWEMEIYAQRENCPFPFEQKVVWEYIVPKYKDQVLVHDPYHLNCILGKHDTSSALFVHVCGNTAINRNFKILKNTKKVFRSRPQILKTSYYKNYYYHFLSSFSLRVIQTIQRILNPA